MKLPATGGIGLEADRGQMNTGGFV